MRRAVLLYVLTTKPGGYKALSIYVDGAGGPDSGFGYLVRETGESFYEKRPGITNNQAEYLAVLSALKRLAPTDDEVTIYSDSKNTVYQLNRKYAIKAAHLRDLARTAWPLMAQMPNLKISWIPRRENLAGMMLG